MIFFSFSHLLFCTSALRKNFFSLFTEKIYSIGFKSFNGPLWNKPFYVILVKVNNNKIKDQNWFKENNFSLRKIPYIIDLEIEFNFFLIKYKCNKSLFGFFLFFKKSSFKAFY